MSVRVSVHNRLPAIQKDVTPRLRRAVAKVLLDILAGGQGRAPIDTGALVNSGYYNDGSASTYGKAVAAARARRADAGITPEATPQRSGNTEVWGTVGFSVAYAAAVEYGTARRSARPFLRPSVEAAKRTLEGLVRSELRGL